MNYLLLVICLAGCTSQAGTDLPPPAVRTIPPPRKTEDLPADFYLALQVKAYDWGGPEYSVTIDCRGHVCFEGNRNVLRRGHNEFELTLEQKQVLLDAAEGAKLFDLDLDLLATSSHSDRRSLCLRLGGQTLNVEYYWARKATPRDNENWPTMATLSRFTDRVEEIANIEPMIGRSRAK